MPLLLIRRLARRATLVAISAVVFGTTAVVGQTVRTGSIGGTIRDNSGAVLPGVTVTLTSPALQVGQIVRTSDASGQYQFVDLPTGLYRLHYDLPGFQSVIREDVRLTTAFAARIDIALNVATLTETVTVSGESPLVDVSSTRGGGTVTRDELEALPTNRNYQDAMLLVPGAQIQGPPQVGEIGFRALTGGHKTYGQSGNTSNSIEGIEMPPNEAPDFAAVEEVDVKTYGNTAEASIPGAVVQLIIRSGGNQFHGRYLQQAVHKKFQANNVDAELRAQGISAGDAMNYYYDFSGDLGGRIIRDTLWFYGAIRQAANERTGPGFADGPGPNAVYGDLDDVVGDLPGENKNRTLKLSYQATRKHKFTGFYHRNPIDEDKALASRFIPFETTLRLNQTGQHGKGEWQGALSDRWLATAMVATGGYKAQYWLQEQSERNPNRLNRETAFETGASFDSRSTITRTPWRHQSAGTLSFFPKGSFGGSHALTTGYRVWNGWQGFDAPSQETGNYRLVFDRIGGVPNQAVEFHARNFPVSGDSLEHVFGLYVSDEWRLSNRLTMNLGLRLDYQDSSVPEQNKIQGPFGDSGIIPRVDAGSWTALAPRFGFAYDLAGDGKTVIKGTYGKYNHDTGVAFAQEYNQNTVVTYSYRWNDRNGNRDYDEGEVNLNINGPDFLNVSGATNNVVNPDLRLPATHEFTGSIERELFGAVSVRGLYVHKRVVDQNQAINILRPYEVYNIALTRRDPGPDGILSNADDGPPVTIYDYDPAYRGAAFVQNMRLTSDRVDSYRNYEIALSKRRSNGWFATTSFLATQNHRWLTLVPQSPNDDAFPTDETWEVNFKLAVGFDAPYGLKVSTIYQAYNGIPGQRTYIFRSADPDGGPPLSNLGSLTQRMEPFGGRTGEARHLVNFRVGKDFPLGGSKRITLDVDALNLFNTNVAWGNSTGGGSGITYASGPTFGFVNRIVSPRNIRFGVGFTF